METKDMRGSIDAIKANLRGYRGQVITCNRGTGKSTAILELAKEDFFGEVFIFVKDHAIAQWMKERYLKLYPDDPLPFFVCDVNAVRGRREPILIDEYWLLPEAIRSQLLATCRVAVSVGS